MIKLENKTIKFSIPTSNGGDPIEINKKYSVLIAECINNPPPIGFSVKEMQTRLRILDILEKSKSSIELEDSDFEEVRRLVSEMKWKILSRDLVVFIETILKK